MDINYNVPSSSKPRTAYRIRVPGLWVHVQGQEARMSVRDVSATGLAVYVGETFFAENSELQVDLILADTPVLKGVSARMVRYVDEGVVAMRFNELSRRQGNTLDKLVLEVQKRFINFRKAKPKGDREQLEKEMAQEVLEETLKANSEQEPDQ